LENNAEMMGAEELAEGVVFLIMLVRIINVFLEDALLIVQENNAEVMDVVVLAELALLDNPALLETA
jgi:hypothetical protein